MRFTLQKCRKTIYWTILFAVISITGIPTANALVIGGRNVGILCGPPHSEPIRVNVGSTFRYITASVTGNVLKAGTADRRIIRHFATIKSVTPNGTIAWQRPLVVQSLAVVSVDLDDVPPTYSFPDTVSRGDRQAVPPILFASECLSVSVANSGNQSYVAVSMGTTSSTGGPVPGKTTIAAQDKTVLNVWILNINNGKVVKLIKVRPKPGWVFAAFSSGIFDADNDFNDELVIAYVKFVGATRYDFMYQHYNVVTGVLERTTKATQFNEAKIQK